MRVEKLLDEEIKSIENESFLIASSYFILNRDGPDSSFAGYLAILKTRYWISGQISGGCRIPDIWPDISMPVCCLTEFLK